MAKLRFTWRFRLDYRRSMREGCKLGKLKNLLALLRRGAPLPLDCRDTAVRGTKARACRVEPGWVLIYQTKEGMVTLLRLKYVQKERATGAPARFCTDYWRRMIFSRRSASVLRCSF